MKEINAKGVCRMHLPAGKLIVNSPLLGAFVLLIWLAIEQITGEGVRPPEQMSQITMLLIGGALALLGWALVTQIKQDKKLNRIITALDGYTEGTGLLADVARVSKHQETQDRRFNQLDGKVKQMNRQMGNHEEEDEEVHGR